MDRTLQRPHGKPVGPFVKKATRELGDITAMSGTLCSLINSDPEKGLSTWTAAALLRKTRLHDVGSGRGRNTALLNHMAEEGIDVRNHQVEFMQYEPFLVGRGIEIDLNAGTSVPGLFAAGDPVGNFRADIAGAATFGWIAGGSASERAKRISGF